MTVMKAYIVSCVMILTLQLGACSTANLRSDETETFLPRITQDGSKLFTYQLDTPSGGNPKTSLVFNANENTDLNTAPEMSHYSAEEEKRQIEIRVIRLLENKLEQLQYCHEGYVVSQRTIGFSRSIVTGECRESASTDDQTRFGKHAH